MCASCGHKITEKGCKKLNRNYCKKCGQRILWEADMRGNKKLKQTLAKELGCDPDEIIRIIT